MSGGVPLPGGTALKDDIPWLGGTSLKNGIPWLGGTFPKDGIPWLSGTFPKDGIPWLGGTFPKDGIPLLGGTALRDDIPWLGGVPLLGGEAVPARRHTRTALRDMDGNGRTEAFVLENRRMTVYSEDEEIWTSDSQWQAEDFLLGDIDRDGTEELVLFVWKRGSYGPVRPFWVEADETGYSQHIFLYRWESGELEPLWMSSRLTPEVRAWELLSDGSLKLLTEAGEETLWGWHNWGLERLDGERKPL